MKQLYYVIQTLLHGRGSNLIKVISLGLGLTMSILLFSRVVYEQRFDTCFKEVENLYQVWTVFTVKGEKYPPQEANCGPVAGALLENFPEQIESATTICKWVVGGPLYNGKVRFNAQKIVADSLFFQTLGIEVLSGDPVKELQQQDVVFLSDRLAARIFGHENPIGKVLSYDHQYSLTVKGTYAALPPNATVRPEAVVSMPTMWNRNLGNYSWRGGDSFPAYVRFRPGADAEEVNARIDAMIEKYRLEEDKARYGYSAYVKPIRDTYRGYDEVKRMRNIMTLLGLAILFIATLNYVLISLSSLSYRAKAVGVHKCSGAGSGTVMSMFLMETAFILLAALLLMVFVLLNFQDFFEDTAAEKLSVLFAPERIWVPGVVVGVLFLVGGVLPGRIFAQIPVTQVFRRYTEGKKGWKRPLLFIQFAGVAFICGLMCVVVAQYRYVLNKDMGYNPQQLVLGDAYWENEETRNAAYHFFAGLPYVEAVTSANGTPIDSYSGSMIMNESGQILFSARSSYYMREDYPEIMGMTFLQGRMARDREEAVVNETFAEMMHWGNEVVGRTVYAEGVTFKVVGLLKDFQISDFTNGKLPFIARGNKAFYGTIHLRLKEPFAANLQKLNQAVAEAYPDVTLDFESYEAKITDRYNAVRVFRNATLLAALTMFFVMLMGLIGYTADEVRRRSKEIAIRKVNGAEVSSILQLLSHDVLWVACPAVLVGIGAAIYVNNLWMDMFAERVTMNWGVYILVALANLVLIVGCVVAKSWRIANENPVKSIKAE